MAGKRPAGVTVVGVLTVLSAIAIFNLALIVWVGAVAGGGPYGGGVAPGVAASVLGVVGFGAVLLADAILLFKGVKYSWHLSIILWIVMLCGFSVFYYMAHLLDYFGLYFIGGYPSMDSIVTDVELLCPFLYTIGSALYFQKRHVKEYFGVLS